MAASRIGELANYLDLLLDVVCVVNASGHFVYVSAGSERVFGYQPEEMVGRNMTDLLHPDDLELTLEKANQVMQEQPLPYFENRYIRKDGSIAHIMWSARWSDEDGLRVAVARDISSRVRDEAKQRATYAISEAANNTRELPELFAQVHRIVGELLPVDSFSIVLTSEGKTLQLRYHFPKQGDCQPTRELAAKLLDSRSNLLHHVHSNEAGITCWLGTPLRCQDHNLGALLVSRCARQDFTESDQELLQFVGTQIASAVERQQMISRLQQLALYDALTQLPNRSLFEDRMRSAMARARRDNHSLCLLFLDLDRFKPVNDTFGHNVGDMLLIETANRLRSCVRESDTVARLGGDEFLILMESVQPASIEGVVSKISQKLSEPMLLDSNPVQIEASIGYAIYPEDGESLVELIKNADMRMYQAKRTTS